MHRLSWLLSHRGFESPGVFLTGSVCIKNTGRTKHNWIFLASHFTPYNPSVKNLNSFIHTDYTMYQQQGNR